MEGYPDLQGASAGDGRVRRGGRRTGESEGRMSELIVPSSSPPDDHLHLLDHHPPMPDFSPQELGEMLGLKCGLNVGPSMLRSDAEIEQCHLQVSPRSRLLARISLTSLCH